MTRDGGLLSMVDLDLYRSLLEAAGFEVLELEDIRAEVYVQVPPWFFSQSWGDIVSQNLTFLAGSAA